MTLINTLIASSVIALGALVQTATPVAATGLVPAGSNHVARHANGHNGMIKRKRNSHQRRKRCIQPPSLGTGSGSGDNSGSTGGSSGGSSGGSTGGSSGGSSGGVSNPPSISLPNPCNGKAGLGWGPSMATNNMQNAKTWKTCYYYDWSSWPAGSDVSAGLNFVPMMWGWDKFGEWSNNILNRNDINYGIALGANEVNQAGQAYMDVGSGVDLWRQTMLPLRQRGWQLGSPSVTNDPSTGPPWLRNFKNALGGNEQPDFWSLHWYGTNANDFIAYVDSCIAEFGKVMITEFACTDFGNQGWACDTMAFANQVVPYLDGNANVIGYFPFAFVWDWSGVNPVNQIFDGNSLTGLGGRYFN